MIPALLLLQQLRLWRPRVAHGEALVDGIWPRSSCGHFPYAHSAWCWLLLPSSGISLPSLLTFPSLLLLLLLCSLEPTAAVEVWHGCYPPGNCGRLLLLDQRCHLCMLLLIQCHHLHLGLLGLLCTVVYGHLLLVVQQ